MKYRFTTYVEPQEAAEQREGGENMEVPIIRWSRGADPTKCTKIVVVAPKDEMEPVNKAISQAMGRLKRLGYCKNGYEIINGVQSGEIKDDTQ